jgi:hypothetical protein
VKVETCNTSLTPPLAVEPSQKSERSCISLLHVGLTIMALFWLEFVVVLTGHYFLFSFFYSVVPLNFLTGTIYSSISISTKGYGCKWTWETIQHFTSTHIKVTEQHCYWCSTFDSHRRVFNNENNSYPKLSVKLPLVYSWVVVFCFCFSLQITTTALPSEERYTFVLVNINICFCFCFYLQITMNV